jgi:hypothetical protein
MKKFDWLKLLVASLLFWGVLIAVWLLSLDEAAAGSDTMVQALRGTVYRVDTYYVPRGFPRYQACVYVEWQVGNHGVTSRGCGYKANVYKVGDVVWGNYGKPLKGNIIYHITRLWKERW